MTLATSPRHCPWDEDRARALAYTVAKRHAPLFAAWPDIDVEDLASEALHAIRQNHDRYDPNYRLPSGQRVRYSTFVCNVAARCLIDLCRWRSRRDGYEQAYRETLCPIVDPDEIDAADLREAPLVDWLGQVYVRARAAHRSGVLKRGPKRYSVPQCVAAVLLMRRLKLSCRAAADLLAARDDMRRALRMTHSPSYGWFFRARVVVTSLERQTRRRRRPAKFVTDSETIPQLASGGPARQLGRAMAPTAGLFAV